MMTPSESNVPESSAQELTSARQEPTSEAYQNYLAKLGELPTPEEKIAHGLQFLRSAISQEGTPRFREFWEARRHLLPLFKQNLNSAIRSQLWNEYVELTVEARRLKEILEEQSVFAMEQIDLAIKALEEDVSGFDILLQQASSVPFPHEIRSSIADRANEYSRIQGELNLLNTLASRLNGLRKEIIKTEMRIRFKTKFFKRLSEIGDHIFPKRKQLIDHISDQFERDIEQFIQNHFKGEEVVGAPYYALRDEIKALQGLAKLLTLNTQVFTKTRLRLSECWDKIKVLEKAHKQELFQKKQVWSDNRVGISAKIEELKSRLEGMDLKQLDAQLDEIQKEMRNIELGKDDVRQLKQEMQQLRAPYLELEEEKRRVAQNTEKERQQLKKEKYALLKEKIASLQRDADKTSDELVVELEEIRKTLDELALGKFEHQQFERSLRPIKDLITERKESALLNLNDDQRLALEQLREVVQQRRQRRLEIKEQLEILRKLVSGSGLDFEKAIQYREQMDLEKERLEKINASIIEVEKKISEIEDNA